jgi:hypothetical protein
MPQLHGAQVTFRERFPDRRLSNAQCLSHFFHGVHQFLSAKFWCWWAWIRWRWWRRGPGHLLKWLGRDLLEDVDRRAQVLTHSEYTRVAVFQLRHLMRAHPFHCFIPYCF